MKKQMIPATAGKKLQLNKKTISNLNTPATNANNWWELAATMRGNTCFTHKCRPSW